MEAIDALDLADEHGITVICISLHNGQALHYTKLLTQLASERNKNYRIYVGGVLTNFVNETDKEPVDVTEQIKELGVYPTGSLDELLVELAKLEKGGTRNG